MQEFLKGLNEDQLKAVTTTEGNIRLIAGAGSGKTNVLTKRLAYIVDTKAIPTSRILNITFTNNAAKEMGQRAAKLLNVPMSFLEVKTFHQLALDICKRDIDKLGYSKEFKIGKTSVSILVKKYLEEKPSSLCGEDLVKFERLLCKACTKAFADYNSYINMMTVNVDLDRVDEDICIEYADKVQDEHDVLDAAKAEFNKNYKKEHLDTVFMVYQKAYFRGMLTPDISKDYHNFCQLSKEYPEITARNDDPIITWVIDIMKLKQSLGTVSYDDLINYALYLLENYEDVREYWQDQFDYIQVDEFQDTDDKQLKIVRFLSEKKGNVFVVGDPDQSIYLFRGAKPQLFNNLGSYFKNLQTMYLTMNYRSSEEIVKVSNNVIKLNRNRINKELISNKGSVAKVHVIPNIGFTDEEEQLVEDIAEEATSKKLKWDTVAGFIENISDFTKPAKENLSRVKVAVYQEDNGKARKPITAEMITDKYGLALTQNNSVNKVIDTITGLLAKGVSPSDIAILYRSKGDSYIEDVYKKLKDKKIALDSQYEAPDVVRDLIEVPTQEYLKFVYTKDPSFLGEVVDNLVDNISIDDETKYEMGIEYNKLLKPVNTDDAEEIFNLFLEIVPHLTRKGTETPIGNYKKLMDHGQACIDYISALVKEFNDLSDEEKDNLVSEESRLNKDVSLNDGIHIMTMHSSKGLEFPYVFVLGLEAGYFPKNSRVSVLDGINTYEEEARLAYVAFSRAKEELFIIVPNRKATSAFVAQPVASDLGLKYLDINDSTYRDTLVKEAATIVDNFLDEETFHSWSTIDKYALMMDNEALGYRYTTVVKGRRIAFDALAQEVDDDIHINTNDNVINVTSVDGRSLKTVEEENNLMYVRTLDRSDVRTVFTTVPNIIELYKKYFA
jgi:superfamily I DNA/RNA helicase